MTLFLRGVIRVKEVVMLEYASESCCCICICRSSIHCSIVNHQHRYHTIRLIWTKSTTDYPRTITTSRPHDTC